MAIRVEADEGLKVKRNTELKAVLDRWLAD